MATETINVNATAITAAIAAETAARIAGDAASVATASTDATTKANAAQAAAIATAASDATTKANAAQAAAISSASSDATTKANAAQAAAIASAASDATTKANAAQAAAIASADSDATTKANAAQAAAIAASQPLNANLTSYANAADAAARRALIGAEDAAYTLRSTISADFTTNSATFVDVTGLSVTIPAGQTWVVIIDGAYQSTNTATGFGVSLTRTGSPTRSNFERRIYTAANTSAISGTVGNIDDAGPINTTVDTANADRHWIMTGNVKTAGSACIIQVRAGRGGSANNISVMAGASIIAHRIA